MIVNAERTRTYAEQTRNKIMEKIKEYKGIIILILIVLAGAFYWYEWRPAQIREKCQAEFGNNAPQKDQMMNALTEK